MRRLWMVLGLCILFTSIALADELKKEPTPQELKIKVAELEQENSLLKEALKRKQHQLVEMESKLDETLQEKAVLQKPNALVPSRVPPSWTPMRENTPQWHYLVPLEAK